MAADTIKGRVCGSAIVLPPEALEEYQLREGDEVELVPEPGYLRIRRPSRRDLSKFVGVLKKTAVTKTTDEYMREIRPR